MSPLSGQGVPIEKHLQIKGRDTLRLECAWWRRECGGGGRDTTSGSEKAIAARCIAQRLGVPWVHPPGLIAFVYGVQAQQQSP